MDRVVYFLGAGFSAPLGLPVMSNFLLKSKDLYFSARDRFENFTEVFETIKMMSQAKNYYDCDLFNIEEILSILEMRELLGAAEERRAFLDYIREVIHHYTPALDMHPLTALEDFHTSAWSFKRLVKSGEYLVYLYFVASLMNSVVGAQEQTQHGRRRVTLHWRKDPEPAARYSVITLNYDLILEKAAEALGRLVGKSLTFKDGSRAESTGGPLGPLLAKLHGSAEEGSVIVPPTWNKTLLPDIADVWRLAYSALCKANHIRILGYSLPESDAYVKFLFKSAVVNSPHLKRIDVVCLDETGEVKIRYDKFIDFYRYRFVDGKAEEYLNRISSFVGQAGENERRFNGLERAHEQYFSEQRDK